MRNPNSYAVTKDRFTGKILKEEDNITCIHCGGVAMTRTTGPFGKFEVLVYRADGTHYMRECKKCFSCDAWICPRCEGKPCNNRFKAMEVFEKNFNKGRIII